MATTRRKTILLVDDEPLTLHSLGRDLRSHPAGYEVMLAAAGETALAEIEQSRFDLVVTDLMMPEVDGFQVLKAAKKKDSQGMVIILTGRADIQAAIDALRLGADDFLQKPCGFEELMHRIENCLDKQELLRKVTIYEKILPVCSYCKKIRTDSAESEGGGPGQWLKLEDFFEKVKGVACTHGCCPECFQQVMAEIAAGAGKTKPGGDNRLK
jgi:DNA-binding response OmpR family regulator